jgi:FtsP/CotA-like multicopper oxidase with cupredoxin domain
MSGLPMKLVGGDSGRYEREHWVDGVVVAPSERAVVDVLFDDPGTFVLQHTTPDRTYPLATIQVRDRELVEGPRDAYRELRVDRELTEQRQRMSKFLSEPPHRTVVLVAEMSATEGTVDHSMEHEGHAESHESAAHHDHDADATAGIEWEDHMVEMNRATTAANMRWKLVDRDTKKENDSIDWVFTEGELVKVRIVNEIESDHPMHHPFHLHGVRFVVLARDGEEISNLVWKDTVLVRTGETVDLIVDASNPGRWMAHCHIPEHMGGGMMFSFDVRRASDVEA